MHPLDRLRETRLLPVLVLLTVIASVYLLSLVSAVLAPFLWAVVTAYILFPVVRYLERVLRLPRVAIVSSLYVVFVTLLVVVAVYAGPLLVDQARSLLDDLPGAVQDAREELLSDPTIRIGEAEIDTREINQRIDEAIAGTVNQVSMRAVPLVFQTFGILIQSLAYFLATFYFLLHGDSLLRRVRFLSPRRYRGTIDRVGQQVNATLGAYIRGQAILFAIMSVATYIALTILDVEYPIVLALMTGMLELVPIIGPWTAGAAAVTVAIAQGHAPFGWSPVQLGIAVALVYFALRMMEDHIVIPQLIGRIVRVHPVMVLFAILAGAHTYGMLGLLLAVPIVATIKIIVQALYYELGNPPKRVVMPVRSKADLLEVHTRASTGSHEQLVLLIGAGAIDWDDLTDLQKLAAVAVANDVPIQVVTPDSFAASLSTAAGLQVVTEARFSEEVGTAGSMTSDDSPSAAKAPEREPASRKINLPEPATSPPLMGEIES